MFFIIDKKNFNYDNYTCVYEVLNKILMLMTFYLIILMYFIALMRGVTLYSLYKLYK